jgi:hypothetical protein
MTELSRPLEIGKFSGKGEGTSNYWRILCRLVMTSRAKLIIILATTKKF